MNELAFQTPAWALVALLVVLPLAALLVARRRSERVARVLSLDPPGRNALLVPVVALVGVAVLVGTAAAQPVLVDAGAAPTRDDAELLAVVDVSRSMLAAPALGAPTRFDRARALARRVRAAVPEVPAGVVSISDRVLPHLFPTPDPRAFATVLDRALAVGRPLPRIGGGLATNVDPLIAVAGRGYFTDGGAPPRHARLHRRRGASHRPAAVPGGLRGRTAGRRRLRAARVAGRACLPCERPCRVVPRRRAARCTARPARRRDRRAA